MANMNAKFMKNAFIGWTETVGLYYPSDFDPSKLVAEKKYNREKRGQKKQPKMMNIRMMMPFSMICSTCGNFSYVGTKFNSRVEKVQNEAYFGCAIYRFYGSCQHCASGFTFKTDPETADYVMESGGSRNYEAWKDADGAIASVAKDREEEAEFDNMKALEQASASAAAEMQVAEALEGLQQLNKRTKNHDEAILQAIDFLYKKHAAEAEGEQTVDVSDNFEDELEAYRNEQLARKRHDFEDDIDKDAPTSSAASASDAPAAKKARIEKPAPPASIVVKTKMPPPSIRIKKKNDAGAQSQPAEDKAPAAPLTVGSLLGGYDSESSSADG